MCRYGVVVILSASSYAECPASESMHCRSVKVVAIQYIYKYLNL